MPDESETQTEIVVTANRISDDEEAGNASFSVYDRMNDTKTPYSYSNDGSHDTF